VTMKLYSVDLSPYSARVRMQIYAKGLSDIVIEGPAADWGTPTFRERLPIGRIPVLDIDGDLMPESEVIAEYLEEVYPHPSLLGAAPRETAHIRTLARLGDIYLINTIFVLWPQALASSRNEAIVELLGGQVARNIKALDRMVGGDGFACSGRLTLADCALVPGLFMVENMLPDAGLENPFQGNARVAAYWAAIQQQEPAARILVELHRGLEERRELIRTHGFDKLRAAAKARMEGEDH
jgi:glutathione S-transferase